MIRALATCLALAFLALAAGAADLGSAHLRVRAAHPTAGGAVFLEPASGRSSPIASAGGTAAAQPLGSSLGSSLEVAAGPWPIFPLPPVQPLPEPERLPSLAGGLAVLALLGRRRSYAGRRG